MNIYCDESCHILNDRNSIMTLGAIIAPLESVRVISKELRAIKSEFGCNGELKWTKVSKKNQDFYLRLVEYFFESNKLGFRALIVHDKNKLDHDQYNQGEHDSFYYKMYFYLIRNLVENRVENNVRIYLDIKDTKCGLKVQKLQRVLGANFYDFEFQKIEKIQQIRSHESELMQLCDFLLGAVTYANRGLTSNIAKQAVVSAIQYNAYYSLKSSTPPWETKVNLFHFGPRGG